MIVICTGCQARFRVADEKIGPRGAKVRCTRCENVFLVQRDAAPPSAAPAFDLDLTPGLARPAPPQDPFAQPPSSAAVIPFGAAPARDSRPAPDPFAAAGLDAFGQPELGGDDPFARAAAGVASDVQGAPASGALAGPAADPFRAPDPFSSASGPVSGAQRLPVTDLSQLLGSPAADPAPAGRRPPAPSLEVPAVEEPSFAASAPSPSPLEPPGLAAPGRFPADLALEERSGSMAAPGVAAPFADPADVFTADPGFGEDGGMFEPRGQESLALANEPTPPPVLAPAPPLSSPSERHGPAGDGAVPGVVPVAEEPGLSPAAAVPTAPARSVEPPAHRVRNAALNALALVALLVLALAIRAVLRGDAALGPAALRPSTLLHSFGATRTAGPFEVVEVRSGVYPQASGSTVLFVRGVVLCRPPAAVEGVRVEAELVRDGQVLSRGEVLAGAVPSPEDVYRAVDRAALDALSADLRKRAPKQVVPGDRLGFLLTLGDAPADLSGTSVRLQAGPDGAPR